MPVPKYKEGDRLRLTNKLTSVILLGRASFRWPPEQITINLDGTTLANTFHTSDWFVEVIHSLPTEPGLYITVDEDVPSESRLPWAGTLFRFDGHVWMDHACNGRSGQSVIDVLVERNQILVRLIPEGE